MKAVTNSKSSSRREEPIQEVQLAEDPIPVIEVGFTPASELRDALLKALADGNDLKLDLAGLSHLEASILQVLLALQLEQLKSAKSLRLVNLSPELYRWFELAGAADRFHVERGANS